MSDQSRQQSSREKSKEHANSGNRTTGQNQNTQPQVVDAIRHVGPTLEQDERFLAVERYVLPENVIADRAGNASVNMRAVTADALDREAEAMGAEQLRTRLPGDTSSDPHTDVGPDNATNLDTDRPKNRNKAA